MKKLISCALLSLTLFSLPLQAEELSAEKKAAIDELMDITGAERMGEMMGIAFIRSMTVSLKRTKPDINPKAFDIIQEEVMKIIREDLIANGALREMTYPLYHKHFSLTEVQEIVRFYKTPVGKKMVKIMPEVTREGMMKGQEFAKTLGPKIEQRILARFQMEGIAVK